MKTIIALTISLLLIGCEQDRITPIKNSSGLRTICFDGIQYIKYTGYSLTVKIDNVTLKPQTCSIGKDGGMLYE